MRRERRETQLQRVRVRKKEGTQHAPSVEFGASTRRVAEQCERRTRPALSRSGSDSDGDHDDDEEEEGKERREGGGGVRRAKRDADFTVREEMERSERSDERDRQRERGGRTAPAGRHRKQNTERGEEENERERSERAPLRAQHAPC